MWFVAGLVWNGERLQSAVSEEESSRARETNRREPCATWRMLRLATLSSTDSMLEMQDLRSSLDLLRHKLNFNKVSRQFFDIVKFKDHLGYQTLIFTWVQWLVVHW